MGYKTKKEPEETPDWGPTPGYYEVGRVGNPSLGKVATAELLRAKVRGALLESNLVDASGIEVGCNDGETIILDGTVSDEEMSRAAAALASGVEGVRGVANRLEIAKRDVA